jgi:AraC family transcriptional regulator of adaptative response/methylated-DNA-[protein]-cysteine methyltransferase
MSVKEGDVLSYKEQATGIGKPKAVRAVASANARNKIGVLIPCHRILRGNGSLGGYRWGLERKRALIDAERKAVS